MASPAASRFITREEWLRSAADALSLLMEQRLGQPCKPFLISPGFGPGRRGPRSGNDLHQECWRDTFGDDGTTPEVFINPALIDSTQVLRAVLHQMLHITYGTSHKAGSPFDRASKSLGLTGPVGTASARLLDDLTQLEDALGDYADLHVAIMVNKREKQSTPGKKLYCRLCSFTARVSEKHLRIKREFPGYFSHQCPPGTPPAQPGSGAANGPQDECDMTPPPPSQGGSNDDSGNPDAGGPGTPAADTGSADPAGSPDGGGQRGDGNPDSQPDGAGDVSPEPEGAERPGDGGEPDAQSLDDGEPDADGGAASPDDGEDGEPDDAGETGGGTGDTGDGRGYAGDDPQPGRDGPPPMDSSQDSGSAEASGTGDSAASGSSGPGADAAGTAGLNDQCNPSDEATGAAAGLQQDESPSASARPGGSDDGNGTADADEPEFGGDTADLDPDPMGKLADIPEDAVADEQDPAARADSGGGPAAADLDSTGQESASDSREAGGSATERGTADLNSDESADDDGDADDGRDADGDADAELADDGDDAGGDVGLGDDDSGDFQPEQVADIQAEDSFDDVVAALEDIEPDIDNLPEPDDADLNRGAGVVQEAPQLPEYTGPGYEAPNIPQVDTVSTAPPRNHNDEIPKVDPATLKYPYYLSDAEFVAGCPRCGSSCGAIACDICMRSSILCPSCQRDGFFLVDDR